MKKWSILIPTLFERKELLDRLVRELEIQIYQNCADDEIEIVTLPDNGRLATGTKRNMLMEDSHGEYVCYFDDDDMPEPNYVQLILEAMKENPDVIPINGYMTTHGKDPLHWEMGLEYEREAIIDDSGIVLRFKSPPNHLSVMKKDLVKDYRFLDVWNGEDREWADRLKADNVFKTEVRIKESIYHYQFTK
jgi:glycosyltransferase involved in cell wall biosynthesis